jgi:hypothetical protein
LKEKGWVTGWKHRRVLWNEKRNNCREAESMALHFLSIDFTAAVLLSRKELIQFLIRESSVKALKVVASFKMGEGRGLGRSPHIPYSLCKRKEN